METPTVDNRIVEDRIRRLAGLAPGEKFEDGKHSYEARHHWKVNEAALLQVARAGKVLKPHPGTNRAQRRQS